MSCREDGFPWLFLTIRIYRPSNSASPLDYILSLYRAVVDKFYLDVQHLLVRVKESTGERRLWACVYFTSSVPHVLSIITT